MQNNKNFLYHQPVLLIETINGLITDPSGVYVDATFGGGGHSKEIIKKLNNKAKLIAIDQDYDSIKNNFIIDKRFYLFHNNFKNIKNILKILNINKVSGILVDLGISSYQINTPNRGFSIRYNTKLDMRMNINSKNSAKKIIYKYSVKKLSNIFKIYGDFKNHKMIALKIIKARKTKNINTTYDLMNLFQINMPFKKKVKFFAKLFQAIRIEVNDEIESLKIFLIESVNLLKKYGRLVIISYHSIEDKLVKNFFKYGIFDINKKLRENLLNNNKSNLLQIHKKVIKPSIEEINHNPRSRSACLRIAEKKY